ncbi:MAG: DUF2442 domain-containing protein [Oscillospiraceae bacterium]|jgi:hypothetical protein|nr:DUF2442 domain-containing protein [Oscillospiraceae bacterium]
MKAFAIKDEERSATEVFGYLLYYEKAKAFVIELPDDADPWGTPLLLSSFLKRGEHTILPYWSRQWVRQRIVPVDRQNLGQILKANGLKAYDEFALLMLANGRCAQDSYYLQEIEEADIPEGIRSRWDKKIEEVLPLAQGHLVVFFKNGAVKRCDTAFLREREPRFAAISRSASLFQAVSILPGGYGVGWGENISIANNELYDRGLDVPLSFDDFKAFVSQRIVNAAQAQALLGCSRQYINELERKGFLHPIREDARNTLYLKSEVMQRVRYE